MVCFCKHTMGQLQLALPRLDVSAELDLALAADMQGIFNWLGMLGLPAAPWQPDELWLDIELPTLSLNASAMATISAFAQLRASLLAQFGIDILIPGQANAFARLTATLNARLSAMLEANIGLSLNASAWMELSATLTAVAQVEAALSLGLFPSPPALGPPLALWRPFLFRLRALLPLISASIQLGLTLSAELAVELSAMLQVMLRIQLPAFPTASLSLMANLTAALSAVAQINASLGIDALTIGLPAVRAMVQARLTATARLVESGTGLSLSALLALLLRLLPQMEFCATLMAPPAVVNAAMSINAQALASMNWNVPLAANLPVLSIGLPVVSFTAQLNAALGLSASAAPCVICDAAAVLRAGLAAGAAGAGAAAGLGAAASLGAGASARI